LGDLGCFGVCVLVWFAGCQGDTVVRQFECSGDSECESSKSCIEGKCVIDDKDKDGFSSKRDCNDNNKRIFPGASEVCDNGLDDNCDGNIDEKPCICLEGEQRPCGVRDVGICKRGVQFCERGQWGECKGGTLPSEELCENGLDDNCNGTVDEQPCVCKDGSKRACGNEEKGSCRKGTETCKDGKWGTCEGEVKPVAEDCNGKDDDCDGSVDEELSGSCYTGPDGTRDRGECKGGVRKCEQGQWSACVGEVKPIAEICDSKDNDCDGLVDNGLEQDCYDGPKGTQSVGICKAGKRACVAGQWGECKGEVRPVKEDCNGKDDDCDGMVDQGLGGPCYLGPTGTEGIGECKAGVRNCDAGTWTACVGQVLPANSDTCGDKKDNNCNGSVDEGCQTNFEIRNTIDTDSGKIDGIVSVGWQGNGQFQLSSLTIPANAQVKVIGSKPLILKVQGPCGDHRNLGAQRRRREAVGLYKQFCATRRSRSGGLVGRVERAAIAIQQGCNRRAVMERGRVSEKAEQGAEFVQVRAAEGGMRLWAVMEPHRLRAERAERSLVRRQR
jgi:hypothetical protein